MKRNENHERGVNITLTLGHCICQDFLQIVKPGEAAFMRTFCKTSSMPSSRNKWGHRGLKSPFFTGGFRKISVIKQIAFPTFPEEGNFSLGRPIEDLGKSVCNGF
jgi:hypothetical protein